MEKLPQPTQTHIISNVYKHNPPILINDNLSSSHCETDTDIIETNEFALIIDSTSSKFTISLFASFIILMISAFISCGFLPNAYQVIKKSQSKCDNPITILPNYTIQCQDFDLHNNPKRGMIVKGLNDENQYVITNTNFYLINPEIQTTLKGDMRFEQYKTSEMDDDQKIEDGIISVQTEYQVDSVSKYNKIYDQKSVLLGLQHQMFYQHTIVSPNQLFILDFFNLSSKPNLKNITMEVIFINSSFTKFSIRARLIFFVLSLIFCIYYIVRYRGLQNKIKVLEHKLILVLSILLVFFNNPLIILTFKGQQKFLVFFTQLTSIMFPVFLVFFWICAFERGDTQNTLHRSSVLKKPLKWVLLVILLAFQLSVYLYKAYNHLLDYVGNPLQDPKPLVVLDYICFSIAFICLIFILMRAVNIFRNSQTMSRYRVLVVISLFFIIYMAIFLFSESFYVFSIKPKSILLVLVFMNIYVFYLQILYQPIQYAIVQPNSSREIVQIPTIKQQSNIPSSTFPVPKHQAPKLSIIFQRSVQQSIGKFSYIDNAPVTPQNKIDNKISDDDNLDNFEIGDPQDIQKQKISRIVKVIDYNNIKIQAIQQQNQQGEGGQQDIDSQRNADSSLIKSNKQCQDN